MSMQDAMQKNTLLKRLIHQLRMWDVSMCRFISKWNGKRPIDAFMYGVSHFGYGYAYPVICILISTLDWANTRLLIPVGLSSFAIEHTAQRLMKRAFKRIRPCIAVPGIKNLMPTWDEFSFPSGHAAGAFLMATVLNHFYPVLMIPCYAAATVIGLSRVYNGAHYPSDVMAGSFLGFCSARLGIILFI